MVFFFDSGTPAQRSTMGRKFGYLFRPCVRPAIHVLKRM